MSFDSLINQTVGIKTRSSNSAYGDKGFGSVVNYSARIEYIDEEMFDVSGKITKTIARIFLQPSVVITSNDRVVLPDGREEDVIRVESVPGGNGVIHHKEVIV